jgi:putative DNA primase/helicase
MKDYVAEAEADLSAIPADDADCDKLVCELSKLTEVAYARRRKDAARELGMKVDVLDKMIRHARSEAEEDANALPHWNVEPWDSAVDGAELLDSIEKVFRRYIILGKGASEALALWTLHTWTMDAGDISPFIVLVSPTKRCGKTSVLIILLYLTPRSELASNISSSAIFRYIESVRPTLLIDEADSFVKENEEMRGILNSGHTKAAANVIRNVEVNGEHRPQRFSTWAPKAIATIRALADTLEDRSVVVTLQRKPKAAKVERLRRRDSDEFAMLRRQAARWAANNFGKLTDPDPAIPDALNDRAADNWRPLLAIADLAGGAWARRARDAACLLSGEGHDSTSVNVELLVDIRKAFGELDLIRSAELAAKLVKDPERPWAEWKHGKPLTQKQLAGLLAPFGITSETVHTPGQDHGKGYKRVRFEEAWAAYCAGQNPLASPIGTSEACKRASADEMGTSSVFRSVQEERPHGSKNANLAYSHAGLHACTDRMAEKGVYANLTTIASTSPAELNGRAPALGPPGDSLDDLDPWVIPEGLRRV